MNSEKLAEQFHESYEELAPAFSYKTRKASAVPWKDVPEQNKKLMIAVSEKVMVPTIQQARAEVLAAVLDVAIEMRLRARVCWSREHSRECVCGPRLDEFAGRFEKLQPAASALEALLREEREKCCKVMCVRCAEGNKPFDTGSTIWLHALKKKLSDHEIQHWNEECTADAIRQLEKARAEGKG
ncbi:hypothetical protein LCGC14_1221700 [marine sediment metagenome]|uniref:Uncharacterized protein n=1 Tax=marine sediment metagenome TaxID=412755 RepID=A0A0F9LY66_9ZZZZ